jgi:hypothetical protein
MLQKLSQEVVKCQRQAREARECAERASEADKQGYFALERRWLMLAESYELVERIAAFTSEASKHFAAILLKEPAPAAARVPCPSCGNDMSQTNIGQALSEPGANRFYFACETCEGTVLRTDRAVGI